MSVAVTLANEAMDASETGLDVLDATGFPAAGQYTIREDSEWMRVTAGQGTTTWTVTRGYGGTTAATHTTSTAVWHVPDTYPDLARIERRLGTVSTADRTLLGDLIDQAHAWMVGRIGMFLGPTTSTSIDVDGSAALEGGRILHVPFGIQSLTTLSMAPQTGGTLATVTSTDVVLGPRTWEPHEVGQPYTWIRFKDIVTGSVSRFAEGMENVRIAGTLGWSEPPNELGELGDVLVVRMFQSRQTGQRDLVGVDDSGAPVIARFLSARDHAVLDRYARLVSVGVH